MFNAPVPPRFRISRQIECISCKEVFTIAEDRSWRVPPGRTDDWRLLPDHYPDTELRYQRNRTYRSITPETRSSPNGNGDLQEWDDRSTSSINCPRCGTDNRNWLHILRPSLWRPSLWIPSALIYLIRFPLLAVGFLVLFFVYRGAQGLEFDSADLQNHQTLIVAVVLAGILPLLLIPPQWQRLRENIHLQRVRTIRPIINISPPLRTGLVLFATFVFLVPFVLFILFPWTFNRGVALLVPEREPTLVQRLDRISRILPTAIRDTPEEQRAPASNAIASLEAVLNEQRFTCERMQIEAMIARVELLRITNSHERRAGLIGDAIAALEALRDNSRSECEEQLTANAVASLQMLRDFEEEECANARRAAAATTPATLPPECNTILLTSMIDDLQNPQVEPDTPEGNLLDRAANVLGRVRQLTQQSLGAARVQRIDSNVSTLERFIEPEQDWFMVGSDFLKSWFWFVGLASLASTVTSLLATDNYVRLVDEHLPRPIFYSVANMTRVVIWEAKRSLEVGDTINQVCWTSVERSPNGGIVLCGLHHDMCEPDKNRDPLDLKVRAQCYIIHTDEWGRILTAEVRDTRAQRPPESSGSSLGTELFGHIPISPREKRVPVD